MNKPSFMICVIVVLLITSCSSISKKQLSQAQQKSRLLIEQARREELKRNNIDAMDLFLESYHQSVLANDLDMQLLSLQGQARIAFSNNDSISFSSITDKMRYLVVNVKPELSYRVYQIHIWRDFKRKDFQKAISYDINLSKLPLNAKIEALSYIIQSKAMLNISRTKERNMLSVSLNKYHRRLKRKQKLHPDLLSNAYYSLSYSDITELKYSDADKWIKKAINLDKNYDLYINLADDYALAGKCQMLQGNNTKAKAYLTFAEQLYEATNQLDEASKINQFLIDISNK